jgi:ferric-dicitrate binding protein FerR (iron transport regulator)
MSNNNDLLALLHRIANGQATDEDIVEYNRWCHAFQVNGLPVPHIEEITTGMLMEIKKQIEHKSRVRRLRSWTKIAAAASVIVLLALGGNYLIHKPHPQLIGQKLFHNIQPGSTKAFLSLSNGQTIALSNARNGQLASQGNSKIIKIDSGLLVYQVKSQSFESGNPMAVSLNTLTVPRGGQYQLVLPDGTKVWLNSASSLTFPTAFTGIERNVSLKGEAYFEVAEDKRHPFKVKVGNMEVEDLGTQFNIMAYSDEPVITTTLLKGSVRVRQGDTNVLLYPGQEAIADNSMEGNIRTATADTTTAVAWKNGYFTFYRTNIYEIMRQISRWYDIDVSYQDSLNVVLNGSISRNVNASEVFKMLELTGELRFIINGKKVTVVDQVGKYQ